MDPIFACDREPITERGGTARRWRRLCNAPKLVVYGSKMAADALPLDAALDSVLSSLERTFILKKFKLSAFNSFITKKDVSALLPTGFDWL